MADHDFPRTCLSAEIHDAEVADYILHFTGCIEIGERKAFYDVSGSLWRYEVQQETNRRKELGLSPNDAKRRAKDAVEKKIRRWRDTCDEEMRRIYYLRGIIAQDDGEKHLVENVVDSYAQWRTEEGRHGRIQEISKWRRRNQSKLQQLRDEYWEGFGTFVSSSQEPKQQPDQEAQQEPDARSSTPTPQLASAATFGSQLSNTPPSSRRRSDFDSPADTLSRPASPTRQAAPEGGLPRQQEPAGVEVSSNLIKYDPDWDINVHALEYMDDPKQKDPNQADPGQMSFNKVAIPTKYKVKQILHPEANKPSPLRRPEKAEPGLIRYFHLPANNMIWVEHAIAQYYGDKPPDHDRMYRAVKPANKTQTHMILRPQFWRGQQHGGRTTVPHARHMRPMCEKISSNPMKFDTSPQNIVLFMPYLHWDTDRQRDRFAREINSITANDRGKRAKRAAKAKRDRQNFREYLQEIGGRKTQVSAKEPKQSVAIFETLATAIGYKQKGLPVEGGRVKIKNKLGQYLIDAARLYEAMSAYRDRELLHKYLAADPPLHPRRTLDQAYYWTLNTTETRDRDQVVYRGTTANPNDFHTWDREKETWPDHDVLNIGPGETCHGCKLNICKVSRVVMVDQLWMWILDQQTIITSFPKRYGVTKNDASGVHKAIRNRLESARQNQIRSVFDLALIIIDECSNTFFDRTKTPDRQPPVIDTFSYAIGNLTNKQTTAFGRLWHWTERASSLFKSQGGQDTAELHVGLLDIKPEGKLQREIKDILEELDIMIHINRTNNTVLRRFVKHVDHIMNPENRWSRRRGLEELHSTMSAGSNDVPAVDTPAALAPDNLKAPDAGGGDNAKAGKHGDPVPGKGRRPGRDRAGVKDPDDARKRDEYYWFSFNAEELLADVQGRIDELEGLRKSAQSTSDGLKDLLALKQQQAGVVQAWQSVQQSEEAVNQGRTILIFTVVTIIFLPLSFMTSVYGMNAVEFGQGTVPVREELKVAFPVSVAIIIITLGLAFGKWLQALLWYWYKMATTHGMIGSGFYEWHLGRQKPIQIHLSRSLINEAAEKVENLRLEIRKKVIKTRWEDKMKGAIAQGEISPAQGPEMSPEIAPDGRARGTRASRFRSGWHRGDKTGKEDIELANGK